MASQKISGLAALTTPDAADLLAIVDVSDTAMAASGTDKKIQASQLLGAAFVTDTHAHRLAAAHRAGRLWKESDTGLVYLDDGTNWIIWKGDGHVRKAADETVNNSNALQNDDHLFFPIEANERWAVEVLLLLNAASASADFKVGWTGPAGATASWNPLGRATDGGSGSLLTLPVTATPNVALTIAQSGAFGAVAGTFTAIVAGWFVAGSTAGTIQFQWAQNTAIAENNTVLTDSLLRLRRLA